MWNWDWKEWFVAALIRAVKTFAQTAGAAITVGATIDEVQWGRVLSVAGVAAVLSLLTSLGGLPEVRRTEPPDESPDDGLDA